MTLIPREDCQFDAKAPVVIAGAGACGLTAALAARDAGADVLVVEADPRPAGSTSMSLGAACAAGSAEQRRHGIEDTAEQFIADVMAKTRGRADPALARTIAHESGPTVDWLAERHDLALALDFAWVGLGHSRPRLHMPPGRTGADLIARLEAAARAAGAEILTEARVDAIAVDRLPAENELVADARVAGVRLARPGGGTEWLGCEALVIATCGFGGNRRLVAEHIPQMAEARYFGHEGNRGDGIAWGMALGGAVADMSAYQGLGTLGEPHAIVVPHPLLGEGGLLVNSRGARFTHEMDNISGMCVPVLAQEGGIAWVVFDGERHARALEHSADLRELTAAGALRSANSVEALAALCGMQAEALAVEIAGADSARRNGTLDRFGRSFAGTAPLAPPFMAVRVTGALFHTQGGLVVDADARVCRTDGRGLPNVFAGGGAARSISGPEVTGYLPGAGLCMALTLGRLAGRSAVRQVQSTQR
jgi:fumarate reductase flavoprotein subunit